MTGDPKWNAERIATGLPEHLVASRQHGRNYAIALALLLVTYVTAIWVSGWATAVIVVGAVVCLVAILLAYRTRRQDHLETDRLMIEAMRRDFDRDE